MLNGTARGGDAEPLRLVRSRHPVFDEDAVVAVTKPYDFVMDIRKDGQDVLPHSADGGGVGRLAGLSESGHVVAGSRWGESGQHGLHVVAVLRLVMAPHGCLAELAKADVGRSVRHRNPPCPRRVPRGVALLM